MTPLTKRIARRSDETVRDGSKRRRIVVTLYPAGFIGLRPERCRREEVLTIGAAYEMAVRGRVEREKRVKNAGKVQMAKRGKR